MHLIGEQMVLQVATAGYQDRWGHAPNPNPQGVEWVPCEPQYSH